MATIRKSITFTEKLNDWIQSLVEQGDYTNESEYIRDLIRHDKDRRAKLIALREAVDVGLNSGVSDQTIDDVWNSAEKGLK